MLTLKLKGGSFMIKYENNQIILSGSTAISFHDKLYNPKKETIEKRKKYFDEIKSTLIVKKVDGKIFIK
jgi:hypothetical protein